MPNDDQDLVQPTGVFSRLMRWAGLTQRPKTPAPKRFGRDEDDEDGLLLADSHPQLPTTMEGQLRLWDQMDQGLTASILDAIAEETCMADYERGRSVWVESTNPDMVHRGMACLDNVKAEECLPFLTRWMCKNGDAFQRLIYQDGQGVLGWQHVCRREAGVDRAIVVERKEDRYGRLVGFREPGQTYRGSLKRAWSWPWDYVHFRLLGSQSNMYGTSFLRSMFNPWWQMTAAQDGILRFRLTRTPDRNMIQVFVGDLPDHEAAAYLNKVRQSLRKHVLIDPTSPKYRVQFNPMAPWEDVFVPVREGEQAMQINPLSGAGNVGEVYDLNHFTDAFFGSARLPKAYFGFESQVAFDSKATLQQQDARAAHTFKRIQRHLRVGFRTLLELHYVLTRPESTKKDPPTFTGDTAFQVQMHAIAYLEEWERMELLELRYRIIEQMGQSAERLGIDTRAWSAYLLLTYAKLPEDFVLRLLAKAPVEPAAGGPPGEGAPTGESAGFYNLSPAEQMAMARMVHASPHIRRILGDLAEYVAEDRYQPMDYSCIPPHCTDDVEDDATVRELNEDMKRQEVKPVDGPRDAAIIAEVAALYEDDDP